MTMERTTSGQLRGVRIAAKGRLLVAVPVALALAWAGFTAYLGNALPADQRHLGLLPFLLMGEGGCAFLGLTLYLSLWMPAGRDLITADGSGLQLRSRRHGDRNLAWPEVAELGWMPGVNSNSGLIGKLRPADNQVAPDRPMWLCNPAGRRWPPQIRELQSLAQQNGVVEQRLRAHQHRQWTSAPAVVAHDHRRPVTTSAGLRAVGAVIGDGVASALSWIAVTSLGAQR